MYNYVSAIGEDVQRTWTHLSIGCTNAAAAFSDLEAIATSL